LHWKWSAIKHSEYVVLWWYDSELNEKSSTWYMMNVISNEFNCLCCKLLHCLAQKIDFHITEHMFRKYGWNTFNISVWIYGPSNDSCTQHTIHPNIIPCNGNLWINMGYLFFWELMYLLGGIQGSTLNRMDVVYVSLFCTPLTNPILLNILCHRICL
jgi:hypothetical protein